MRPPVKRAIAATVVLAGLAGGGAYAWDWWARGRFVAATDNAYVHADVTAVGPKVAGYVAEVPVGDNQAVRAGEVLLRLDDADFRAQADRARAAVAQALAAAEHLERRAGLQRALIREADTAIAAARADVELTGRNLARATELVGGGWTPRSTHDTATAAARRATAALARAEAAAAAAREQLAVIGSEAAQIAARRTEAEAGLRLAEIALADTVIRAPVSGVVGNRRVQPGEYVRPGAMLMSVVPVEGAWIVANLKETQLARLRVGQTARVIVDGFPGAEIGGVVDSLAPASGAAFSLLPPDNATGNFTRVVQRVPVKIRLAPGHPLVGRLVPGLSAEVAINLRSPGGDAAIAAQDGAGATAAMAAAFRNGGR